MSLPVKLTEAALADLDEIWLYIARDDIDAADRFIDLLHEKCHELGGQPEMGRKRDELALGVRSFPVRRRYLILYQVGDEALFVLRLTFLRLPEREGAIFRTASGRSLVGCRGAPGP